MKKIRKIGCLAILLLIPIAGQAQKISFESILDGLTKPMDDSFHKALESSRFVMVSPYKSRLKPETWGYAYNADTRSAESWVHYYFDKSLVEKKKNKKTFTIDLNIVTYGPVNKLHFDLQKKIKETCKFGGTLTDDLQGYRYDEYVHESGAFIRIYSLDEENHIDMHNIVKIDREK